MKCTKCGADVGAGYNYPSGFECPTCGAESRDAKNKLINDRVMRVELLEKYFKKSSELQLAYDGLHPKFKDIAKQGAQALNHYVIWCNARKNELTDLRRKINAVK